jgi:hypothetical protein
MAVALKSQAVDEMLYPGEEVSPVIVVPGDGDDAERTVGRA